MYEELRADGSRHFVEGLGDNRGFYRFSEGDSHSQTPTNPPLVDHPAVIGYRNPGIDTIALTSFIESFASLRAHRVKGIGHDQYSKHQGQNFENFSVRDMVRELVEELADAGNYIDFLSIKLLSIVSALDDKGIDCD